ncbi:hypothetical protein AVEN_43524-1 [Araneus ventricosus]|uniref:Uncharacterized protein n=1 Tax=Araneus ventricosus TaxID=182803 RepID=A0A4Y2J7I0_ARAVE|nr:hypothetical protein AVEN_43524-1 [Araneus ventricosus]
MTIKESPTTQMTLANQIGERNVYLLSSLTSVGLGFKETRFQSTVGCKGLKQRITDVIHSVTPDVLTRVWEVLDFRLDVCRATNGAHIELP